MDPPVEWQHSEGKLVHTLEEYDIDLATIKDEKDILSALQILALQTWATRQVIEAAEDGLDGYLMWLRAEERIRQLH